MSQGLSWSVGSLLRSPMGVPSGPRKMVCMITAVEFMAANTCAFDMLYIIYFYILY